MKQVLGNAQRAASLGVYDNWGEGCDVLRCSWRGKRVGERTGINSLTGENLDALSPHLAGKKKQQRRPGNDSPGRVTMTEGSRCRVSVNQRGKRKVDSSRGVCGGEWGGVGWLPSTPPYI